jgi:hypothetical protein
MNAATSDMRQAPWARAVGMGVFHKATFVIRPRSGGRRLGVAAGTT